MTGQRLLVKKSDMYLARCLEKYGYSTLSDVPRLRSRTVEPLSPVRIRDAFALTASEREELAAAYRAEAGVAYFVTENRETSGETGRHPIHALAQQLDDILPLKYPVEHPLERHADVLTVAGAFDGTTKVFTRRSAGAALSSAAVETHQDGLGCLGAVETAILFMERPPLVGGFTHFRNVARLALDLAKEDGAAFRALFLPDMITVFRNAGFRALRVVGPVLYLGRDGGPKCFLRVAGGEYEVVWRDDTAAARRAARFLAEHGTAFAPGTTFVCMSECGHGCIIDNGIVAHGRTAFVNGTADERRRLIARKWYAMSEECQSYRHAPGLWAHESYADVFPELFGSAVLEGEWVFDHELKRNVRRK